MGWKWVDEGDGAQANQPQPDGQATQAMMNARAAGNMASTPQQAAAFGQQQQAQAGQAPAAPAISNQQSMQAAQMQAHAPAAQVPAQAIGNWQQPPQQIGTPPAAAPAGQFANYAQALGKQQSLGRRDQLGGPAPAGQAQNMQNMESARLQSFGQRGPGSAPMPPGAQAVAGVIGGAAGTNAQNMDEQRKRQLDAQRAIG